MAPFLVRLYKWSVGSLYTSLYNDLDGVKTVLQPGNDTIPDSDTSPASHRIINRRYLLPCFLYSFYLLDALYLLLCGNSQWSFSGNATSDGTIGRKYLPARVAQQADVYFLEITCMFLTMTVHLLLHNMESFERKYRMFAHLAEDGSLLEMTQKGQVLPNLEAKDIFKLHLKCEKISHLLTSLVILLLVPFYNFNVAFNWTSSAADVKAALWITFTFPYISLDIYTVLCCFVFNCRYLRIRQRLQMKRLESLAARSNRFLGLKPAEKGHRKVPCTLGLFTWSSWSLFRVINFHLNDVNQQITGYSHFWSRYLSVYFTGFIFMITYMAFIVLILDATKNMLTIIYFAYFAFLLLCLLLWITLECSVLVVNNKETLKLQRIFTVHTSRIGKIPLFAAIKFDHIEADSKSIDRIGFKLLDSVQIDSKMFEMLFFYISSLFMKIVQHQL